MIVTSNPAGPRDWTSNPVPYHGTKPVSSDQTSDSGRDVASGVADSSRESTRQRDER